MVHVPIVMPQLGESIAEATVVSRLFEEGQVVTVDAEILEVETNKATMAVTAPCNGAIARWDVAPGETRPVGATLGVIAVDAAEAAHLGLNGNAPAEPSRERTAGQPPAGESASKPFKPVQPTVTGGLPVPAHANGISYLSPRMKTRMAELGLHAADMAGIPGSGAGGRVTIGDLEKFLESLERNYITPASSMRVAVADAMRRSWTRPLATVVLPIGLDALLKHRRAADPKPGPALYALRALAIALGENSAPAGRLVGERIVHPRAIDIGFAVEAEDGVLVPVIRHADRYKLADLAQRYNRLVEQARLRRLAASDTGGSIATVTNYGVFGLTFATPIPLPEQTLLLGMGAGQIVPRWDAAQERFLPVTEAMFTLSFDHRVLDGGAAGRLLARVAALLNDPESL